MAAGGAFAQTPSGQLRNLRARLGGNAKGQRRFSCPDPVARCRRNVKRIISKAQRDGATANAEE
ncbi:unnamed protein product [Miscanthus lutarioriparius]|uniref:Uncharacterized protein n=1 Tax=Miscanthus lutarioriparius TaxID=422564 RepID=A0A811MMV0_9POAL|nr:unnamed protein product [Miscanthus lutarioriparius]